MIICVRFCGRRPTASAPPRTGAARRVAGRGRRLHRGSGRGWSSWREAGRGPTSWPRPSAGEAIARPPHGAARRLAGRDAVIASLREAGLHWCDAGRGPSSCARPSAGGAGTIESSVSTSRVAILLGSLRLRVLHGFLAPRTRHTPSLVVGAPKNPNPLWQAENFQPVKPVL